MNPKQSAVSPTVVPAADEDLLRRGVLGERNAFAELIYRHQDGVFQFVTWYIGSSVQEAEDLTQDVFLQVCRSAGSFKGRSSFRTWLYSVTRNLCHHRLRARKQQLTKLEPLNSLDEEQLLQIPDYRPSALEAITNGDQDRLVREAVEKLAERHRIVLALRDWQDLSYEDIAKALAVPVGTVRSRLHNARAALAELIRPVLEEAENEV